MSETRWTLVEEAAEGGREARRMFADEYLPVVRAYLHARWRSESLRESLDDAVQDVFMACLAPDTAMARLDREGAGRFRTWLYQVTLNVARRHEERRAKVHAREGGSADEVANRPTSEATLSLVFDRSWARAMIRRGVARLERDATDERRRRRLDLLRLRFGEGLPIRAIAERWETEAAALHHEYARAREEFKEALRAEVAGHEGRSMADVERECAELLARL